MKKVRLGIIGLGNMGSVHAASIQGGKVPRLELAAVADADPAKHARAPGARAFTSPDELLASGLIDAVLIATPHYDHTTLGIKALQAGLHVMVEKPVSVHKADAQRLIAAYTNKRQVFAAMFNQRTDDYYLKIRQLVRDGGLGEIRRVNWIITNWFRTEHYYASGSWRATWKGEGGGVLLNQCPHNLDLFQWMIGMPKRVRATCGFGKYHDIEVEDDVTAYFEFPNGATGVFITSTGEAPGTNRLEIAGERGRLVYEDDKISFIRNERPMTEFSRTVPEAFGRPKTENVEITARGHGGQHNEILANFTDAILDGAPLISPAVEGIHSVELANAMLMSAWTGETIELPLDAERYERLLQEKIANSKVKKKKKVAVGGDDFAKSFGR
ncbi:MAG TPA: Gfo/Idh/MocA family oxidoreductase [Opitutaceae bacterium]|nr:Gfo/Idh/MocA family oxidoreductase [Opitutaceae bacterium]